MGIQGPGDFFDTIVLGERQRKHWISSSNGFSRPRFSGFDRRNETEELLIVMVYHGMEVHSYIVMVRSMVVLQEVVGYVSER